MAGASGPPLDQIHRKVTDDQDGLPPALPPTEKRPHTGDQTRIEGFHQSSPPASSP